MQRAAFTATDVLGFVKTECGEAAERPQRAPFIAAKQTVRVVFDDCDAMRCRGFRDGLHIAAHTGVVDRNDRLGRRARQLCDLILVEIQRVGTNVYEPGDGAAQNERVHCGNESERGNDHLITGLDFQ